MCVCECLFVKRKPDKRYIDMSMYEAPHRMIPETPRTAASAGFQLLQRKITNKQTNKAGRQKGQHAHTHNIRQIVYIKNMYSRVTHSPSRMILVSWNTMGSTNSSNWSRIPGHSNTVKFSNDDMILLLLLLLLLPLL